MNWIHFSILTIVLYTSHDVILKYISNDVHPSTASIFINASAAIALLIGVFVMKLMGQNSSQFSYPMGKTLLLLLLAGLSLGLATITFMRSFSEGGQFSVVLPIVYVGIILISVLVGLLFFKERLSMTQSIGVGLSFVSIYLMLRSS